ncbi:sensor histidine kinase [Nonomuraea sp. NPDC005983]|uniref:sensor histidine kinase n=1 Tax=Nonomuraea sp. NPDC005983 TaxID=3155595 RepID=UPI0033B90670
MTPEPSRIAATVLRLGAIALFVVAQSGSHPGLSLKGEGLGATLLTASVVLTLLVAVLPSAPPAHGAPHPAGMSAPSLDGGVVPGPSVQRTPGEPGRSWVDGVAASLNRFSSATLLGVPVKLIALGLGVVLSIVLDWVAEGSPAIAVLYFCVGAAGARYRLAQALPIVALAATGLLVSGADSGQLDRDLSLIFSIGVVFLVMYSIKERRAARAVQAREAVLAERARIAREIHDILAHSLSAQIVHLEGAKLLLRAERNDEALERVVQARDLAKSGLEEARRAVSALREDPPALPSALRTLADDFETATGQSCTLCITGTRRRLQPETELTLIRTAQEALTNVRRHAPGRPAAVRLAFATRSCDLEVTNPAASAPGDPGGGYGLMGMRERAELLGGTLTAGETPNGFRVHLKVPA